MRRNSKEVFNEGGWTAIWRELVENKLTPEEVARFAEKKARELEGRPPLDPFWLEGEASRNQLGIAEELRANVFLAWLNEADFNDAWEKDRVGFEVMYLHAIGFVGWQMTSNWIAQAEAKTLAEAVLFEVPREDVFEWHWDWGAIRSDWWAQVAEFHPTKLEKAVVALIKSQERWSGQEKEKIAVLLDVWDEHPETKRVVVNLVPGLTEALPLWEQSILEWRNESQKMRKKNKPTL